MRLTLYRILSLLALPLVFFATWKRCKKYQKARLQNPENPPLKHCIKSRFGLNPSEFNKGGIWVHAVSVGETRSIFPLLSELHRQHPDLPITLTNGSTQGAIQSLNFAPIELQHQMIPFDYTFAIKRFLTQLEPKLVIMVETEIWPNLYQACSNRHIPIVLANARLKEASFKAYQKWGGKMIANTLNHTQFIAAQSPTDADFFIKLGASTDKVKMLGNLKFDMQISATLLTDSAQWKRDNNVDRRFIWVAASTHANPQDSNTEASEESLILNAHQQLLAEQPNALLILIPRHAARFNAVAQRLDESDLIWARRSKNETINANTQVYLADSVGELMTWFASCNVAFIGGSLVPFGGHNILEPAALSKPVLSGPHFNNLKALYQTFIDADAIQVVDDPSQLSQALIDLAKDPAEQALSGQKAYECYQENSGALSKLLIELNPHLR